MTDLYRIKDWESIYENSRSVHIKDCQWLPLPNKQDGLGYNRLIHGHGNGVAHYGVFIAMLCLCSRQTPPRFGWLTDNGQEDGEPLTAHDVSLQTRIPAEIIVESLPRLANEAKWIEIYRRDGNGVATTLPYQSLSLPPNGIERNRIERKDVIGGSGGKGPKPYKQRIEDYFSTIEDDLKDSWKEAYPNVQIEAEIAKAKAWLISNPRKAKKDFRRFLNNWLSTAMERSPEETLGERITRIGQRQEK